MQFMADLVLTCDACHGKRFRQDILEVKYRDKNIYDVLEMTINQAIRIFQCRQRKSGKRIVKRMKPLQDVGLGYVKLGQSSSTLSGGESQRVKLASILADEKPEPTLFIFDEPTTGLHIHDIKTLMKAFDALIAAGHTVIIIEHNLDVIKCADYIIDIGPEGGEAGGNLVFAGTPEDLLKCKESYTAKYLKIKWTKTRNKRKKSRHRTGSDAFRIRARSFHQQLVNTTCQTQTKRRNNSYKLSLLIFKS